MPKVVLASIGGGNMARALIVGSISAGVLTPADWAVAEPDAAKRAEFDRIGVLVERRAVQLASHLGPDSQLLLAVKPQSLAEAGQDAAEIAAGRVVISILAGTPSTKVRSALGGDASRTRIIRAMPNTPAQIGQGCTAVAIGSGALPGDEAVAIKLFGAVGPIVEGIDEPLMDAFTAVAGSGPAYIFYLAEAMLRGAIELGFDPATADRVVRQVITGSAGLLAAGPDRTPAELRSAVTSKGGTTEAACGVLDSGGAMGLFMRALSAARDRGRELSR